MDEGPGTDLGSLGFYVSLWVVMMAAMMLPVGGADGRRPLGGRAAQARARPRAPARGGSAALRRRLPARLDGVRRCWPTRSSSCSARSTSTPSSWAAAAATSAAGRDRGRGRLPAHSAQGRLPREVPQPARLRRRHRGATARLAPSRMGIEQGAWCVGCCWALMATLFALGLMSIAWMAVVAGLIAVEKLLPWERAATGVALVAGRARAGASRSPGVSARADRSRPVDASSMGTLSYAAADEYSKVAS